MHKPKSPIAGVIGGGMFAGPIGAAVGSMAETLAQHLKGSFDSRKAIEIANRLTSPDEAVRHAAIKEVSENPQAMSRIGNIVNSINSMLSKSAGPAAGIGASRMGAQEEVNRSGRAAGGKVGKRDYPARKLTRMEKALKRAQDAMSLETKSLMQIPDAQIAQALDIAKDK
jgi:dipeptidase